MEDTVRDTAAVMRDRIVGGGGEVDRFLLAIPPMIPMVLVVELEATTNNKITMVVGLMAGSIPLHQALQTKAWYRTHQSVLRSQPEVDLEHQRRSTAFV